MIRRKIYIGKTWGGACGGEQGWCHEDDNERTPFCYSSSSTLPTLCNSLLSMTLSFSPEPHPALYNPILLSTNWSLMGRMKWELATPLPSCNTSAMYINSEASLFSTSYIVPKTVE